MSTGLGGAMRRLERASMGLCKRVSDGAMCLPEFKDNIQYALVFASMHCSPITCSSCAETPWIKPFSSLTGSAATGLKEVVDMAKGREGKSELARRGQLYDDDGGAQSGELPLLAGLCGDLRTTTSFRSEGSERGSDTRFECCH